MGNRVGKNDKMRTMNRPKTARATNPILKQTQRPTQPAINYPEPSLAQQRQQPPPVNYNTIPQQQPPSQQFKTQPQYDDNGGLDRPYRQPPQFDNNDRPYRPGQPIQPQFDNNDRPYRPGQPQFDSNDRLNRPGQPQFDSTDRLNRPGQPQFDSNDRPYRPGQPQFDSNNKNSDRLYRPGPQTLPPSNENLQTQRRSAMQQKPIWGEPLETPRRPTYDIQKWKNLIKMLQENLKLINYVFSRPRRSFTSMNELGVFIRNSPAQSDIETAWVIYVWMSQNIDYDVDGFRTGFYNDLDLEPDGVLQSGRTISWGYAHFFEELCRANDIECISISGFAKGLTFRQNHAFIDPNHEWNAIKLNGVWQFVDVTWGTGYVSDEFIFYRKFVPHYFLTPPQVFIYDHYSEQYQLQPQKMSLRRFEKLPLLKLEYFLNDVRCLSHDIFASIRPIERNFKMEFSCADDTILLASLERLNGDIIEHAIAIQHDRIKNSFEFLMTLPNGRDSLLNLFTRKNGEESQFCGEIYIHTPASVEASIVSLEDSDDDDIEEEVYLAVQKPRRKAAQKAYVEVVQEAPEEEEVEIKSMPVEWKMEFKDKGPYEIVVPPDHYLAVEEKYDYYIKDENGRTSKLMVLDPK